MCWSVCQSGRGLAYSQIDQNIAMLVAVFEILKPLEVTSRTTFDENRFSKDVLISCRILKDPNELYAEYVP